MSAALEVWIISMTNTSDSECIFAFSIQGQVKKWNFALSTLISDDTATAQ
jgi:hypothetical protein